MSASSDFTRLVGIETPVICGAMYPCSNPELVAAVSEAGGMGVVQPLSLVFVYKYEFRQGLRKIKSLTQKPIGMNLIVEKSAKAYEDRMRQWLDIALEEGVKFFITALGNPRWVAERVHAAGGIIFHDVTERKWAEKALEAGVDGLICVNNRAGGHAGSLSPEQLMHDLKELKKPLVCAGGVGDEKAFKAAMELGYSAVQMGTRFIATQECSSHADYKKAILEAEESDIVMTNRVTGVPLAVIKTPYLEKTGTNVSPVGSWLLKHPRTKHWARLFYSVRSVFDLRRSSLKGYSTKDFYQAGKSVAGVESIEPAGEIVRRFSKVL